MSLAEVKIRLEIPEADTSRDAQLQLLITDTEDAFKRYCRRSDIPADAVSLIDRLVVLYFQNRAGVKSESISDMSVSYLEELPVEVKKELNRYRRILAQ